MISVIIPLYNKESTISHSTISVLNQTVRDFEIIIINDGSTDKSAMIVEEFNDPRIRLIHQSNQGVSAARNTGIKNAKYDWIAFLDGDDLWDAEFLRTLIDLTYRYPDAGIYCGQYVQFDKKRDMIYLNRFPLINEGYFFLNEYLYAICSSSILVKKEVFDKSGLFDEGLTHGEDTDMWIRIALNYYKICYTNKIIAYYNIGASPLSTSAGKVPSFEKHFISKIDLYLKEDTPFYNILLTRKIAYLKHFYLYYPYNQTIRKMIKSLPESEIRKPENLIFRQAFLIILTKHFLLKLRQQFVRLYRIIIKAKPRLKFVSRKNDNDYTQHKNYQAF